MTRNGRMTFTAMALCAMAWLGCSAADVTSPVADQATLSHLESAGGDAAVARVRCELRQGRRSKISVDGKNLSPAGAMFSARVWSGPNVAVASARQAVGDEAEFDFDSDRGDIAQGATAIARDFIRIGAGPDVIGEVLDAAGNVVASGAVDGRVR